MSVFNGKDYGNQPTPEYPNAGAVGKASSHVKLENLKELDAYVYDVRGESIEHMREFLESPEGKLCEWYDGKIVQKTKGFSEGLGAGWIMADYMVNMRDHGWTFAHDIHIPGADHAFIPDGIGILRWGAGGNNRHITALQCQSVMALRPLPHVVLEVEWEHQVNGPDKGIPKIRNRLFPMIGPDGSRIEEGWVLSLPYLDAEDAAVNVQPVPEAEQPVLEMQAHPPTAGTPYLVILQRQDNPALDEIKGYYHIPDFSILSATKLGAPTGPPTLYTNILLDECQYIRLVAAPMQPMA